MKRLLHPSRRTRRWLVLLAVLAMLFQQVALASYVCSPANLPAHDVAMSMHCDDMPMMGGSTQANAAPALCAHHCAQQTPATQDVHAPTVPPLLMPALLPAPIVLATLLATHAAHDRASERRLSGIPPTLRFRVLLI